MINADESPKRKYLKMSLPTSSPTNKKRLKRRTKTNLKDLQARWRRGEELRAHLKMLPTVLERDTALMPDVLAEDVVREVELFLGTNLPKNFAARLEARAHYLYSRHRHFHQGLNRPGNRGRENLLMFMRHWMSGWLRREQSALYQKLPQSFGLGHPLPPGINHRKMMVMAVGDDVRSL